VGVLLQIEHQKEWKREEQYQENGRNAGKNEEEETCRNN
jgi:hypothetical protein